LDLGQVEGSARDGVVRRRRARLDVLARDLRGGRALAPGLGDGREVLLPLGGLRLVAVEENDLRLRGRATLRARLLADLLALLELLVQVGEDLLAARRGDALDLQAGAVLGGLG